MKELTKEMGNINWMTQGDLDSYWQEFDLRRIVELKALEKKGILTGNIMEDIYGYSFLKLDGTGPVSNMFEDSYMTYSKVLGSYVLILMMKKGNKKLYSPIKIREKDFMISVHDKDKTIEILNLTVPGEVEMTKVYHFSLSDI